MKISQDYLDRYSTELQDYWQNSTASHPDYQHSVQSVTEMMEYLTSKLIERVDGGDAENTIR